MLLYTLIHIERKQKRPITLFRKCYGLDIKMDRSDFRHYFNSAHKSQTGKWAINRFVLPRWYTDIAAPQLEQKNYGKIEIYLSIFFPTVYIPGIRCNSCKAPCRQRQRQICSSGFNINLSYFLHSKVWYSTSLAFQMCTLVSQRVFFLNKMVIAILGYRKERVMDA